MPDKKRYEIGQIVFLEEDGEMRSYKVRARFDFFQTYMLESCAEPSKKIEVHESQLRQAEEYNATIVDGKTISEIVKQMSDGYKQINATMESWLDTMSDEELDAMAPPENISSESHNQEAYYLMYNAICSVENIMHTILRCATSENKLSDAELLAMRDRAEEFGCADIVCMIDGYFEEGESNE